MNPLYQLIQVTSLVVSLIAGMVLLVILGWLIGGHGVIACGKGVFDSATWLSDIMLLVGVPATIAVASATLYRKCSSRLGEA